MTTLPHFTDQRAERASHGWLLRSARCRVGLERRAL